MQSKEFYSSVDVPVMLGNQKIFFFLNNRTMAIGTKCQCDPHDHSCYEIQYTVCGNGKFFLEKAEYSLSAGDLLLIRPGEWHYQTTENMSDEIVQFRLRFSLKPPSDHASSKIKKNYADICELLQKIRVIHDPNLSLKKTFQDIATEIEKRRDGYLYYLQALCNILFIEVLRLSELYIAEIFPAAEPKYSGYWRDRVEVFLRLRYMENIKLQDLAESIQLSTRQASRLIMREFGVNYITKLNEIRLNQARFLLENSDKSIHQISTECGFQNYTYFATCFKRATNMTPLEFRAMLFESEKDV